MQEITIATIQTIAGTIEALLLEQQEGINFSYKKIPDGIKVSIGVNLDPTSQGVEVNYTLNYPLEANPEPAQKQTVKKKQIINEGQANIMDAIENMRPKKDSGIESITISSGEHSATLEARD